MSTSTLLPLESNPEVMNKFLQKIGVSAGANIVDVMGIDPDMLSWIPQPVYSLLLLFPTTDAYEAHKREEENLILSKGQDVSNNVFYMKQNIDNACGTVALIHSLANNLDKIHIKDGALKTFLDEVQTLDPAARGKKLEASLGIINAHKELAEEGQTNAPNVDEPVNYHFVSFVHVDGALYELDGRKAFPINHGPTEPGKLLEDAAKVCKQFMNRDPNEVRFTIVALVGSD